MASTFLPRFAASALVLSALSFAGAAALADDPPKERYYFELKGITPEARAEAGGRKSGHAAGAFRAQKAFEHHPQIVASLEGAPDPKLDPDGYRSYLGKSKITAAYNVTIEITDATETFAPLADKPGAQQREIRLALRMLGTHIPDDTLGFTGHGKARVEQEVGAKVSERERQETWAQVSELAVSQAMKNALEELTLAAKIKTKPTHKPKPAGKARPPAAH